MKLAASTIQNTKTPGLAITRTKPMAKADVRVEFDLDVFLHAGRALRLCAPSRIESPDTA